MTQALPRAAAPRREHLDGDVSLYVEAHGEGPVLCLAHGFGGSARNWRPQARALADRYCTVTFDLRGHARSAAPTAAANYQTAAYLDDFGRVLDWAGVASAVVGGLSLGASLAAQYALAAPERVRGLVLAAFPPAAPTAGARGEAWATRFADAIDERGLEAAGAEYAWGPRGGFDSAAAALVKAGFLEHPPYAIAHTLREVLAHQPGAALLAPRLAALAVPILVVVGERDRLSLKASNTLAGGVPTAELQIIEAAGHVVNLERREAVTECMAAFLARFQSAAPNVSRTPR